MLNASAAIQSSLRDQQKSALLSLNEARTMAENKKGILRKFKYQYKECEARNLLLSSSVFQGVISGAAVAAGIVAAVPRIYGMAQDTGDHGKIALLSGVGGLAALGADIMRGTAEYVQMR
ncbi:hypothetical protein ABN09_05880 [Morganella morganii]|nr:hypothetical protein ABN09_05880 [Morganella morganii]